MTSILKADEIQDAAGNNIINENADTITIGAAGDTVTVPGTEVKSNKLSPASGTALQIGDSGDTITIPSGATIANSGTATGFGGTNTPNFWIYKASAQTISNTTATSIAFDSAVIDTASGLGSNKWTVPSGQGGTYFLTFRYIWLGTWDARIIAYLQKNGSSIFGMQNDKERVDGGVHVNGIATLSAGDYLEGIVYQDSGSSRDIVGGSLWNALSGFKLL